MKTVYGAKRTLAIDVGAQDDVNFTNYGDELSGWEVSFKRGFKQETFRK